MNTESVDCRRRDYPNSDHIVQVGDFCWGEETGDERYLYIRLPGEVGPDAIRVRRGAPGGERVWGWDGNEDRPTLQPSINAVGVWHGHLVAGRLVSC